MRAIVLVSGPVLCLNYWGSESSPSYPSRKPGDASRLTRLPSDVTTRGRDLSAIRFRVSHNLARRRAVSHCCAQVRVIAGSSCLSPRNATLSPPSSHHLHPERRVCGQGGRKCWWIPVVLSISKFIPWPSTRSVSASGPGAPEKNVQLCVGSALGPCPYCPVGGGSCSGVHSPY